MPLEVLGYAGAILMGLSLGLIGGGGSILTVPILVYLFGVEPLRATTYSLFLVGITSLMGSLSHLQLGNVRWRMALAFGAPSITAVWVMRQYILPVIPEELFRIGSFTLTKSIFVLTLFAVLMILAARKMIFPPKLCRPAGDLVTHYPSLLIRGLLVGLLTGLLGAGGGFLIIPALVLLAHLPMKQAVGTSLVIIAANALLGFAVSAPSETQIQWGFLWIFAASATVGILAGSMLSRNISEAKLKPAFGWAVLAMGCYIIAKELFVG